MPCGQTMVICLLVKVRWANSGGPCNCNVPPYLLVRVGKVLCLLWKHSSIGWKEGNVKVQKKSQSRGDWLVRRWATSVPD